MKNSKKSKKHAGKSQAKQTQAAKAQASPNEPKEPIRKCSQCGTPASEEKKLRFCSKCHVAMYCSPECQLEDWKKHKKECSNPDAPDAQSLTTPTPQLSAAERLKKLISAYPPLLPKHPSGLTWVELDAKLEQWVKHFGNVLMYSTVHALKLPLFFPRARTHLLRLVLLYNPDNGGNVGRFFDLDEADVVPAEVVARMDTVAKMSVERLRSMSQENERDGQGVVSGVALLCKPLKVQMVPIGSITPPAMKRIQWVESWEKSLRRCLEKGDTNFDSED